MPDDATTTPTDDELFELIRREIEQERAAGRDVDAGWLIERHGPQIMERFALLSRLLAFVGATGSGSTPSAAEDPPAAPPAESEPAARPEALTALPDEIGDFQILRPLGQGGMGVVLLARQKNLNRLVALKVLSPVIGWDKEQLDRFHREILTASRLRHPNIAHVYTSELHGPIPHYAMEYIDGQTLGELAEQERAELEAAGRTLDSGSRRRDFVLTHVGYVIQAAPGSC